MSAVAVLREQVVSAQRLVEIHADPYSSTAAEIRWLVECLGDERALAKAARTAPKQRVRVKWKPYVIHNETELMRKVLDSVVAVRSMETPCYPRPCCVCGGKIPRTGRAGRPPKKCQRCR